jgi:DNA (cytosine-5)-methyltransferase 1
VKVLNLYAGLGGNRKLWTNVEVTAVENNAEIAAVYKRLNPSDEVVTGDAHEYLLANFSRFNFIWASPPCQSHSRMNKWGRNQGPRYADMMLWQEIILLKEWFDGQWVVENVVPYYEPLIPGMRLGRHMFWANFWISPFEVPSPIGFINKATLAGKREMMDWLGIHYPENIYYGDNHDPTQILRNCVHPKLGAHIMACAGTPNAAGEQQPPPTNQK